MITLAIALFLQLPAECRVPSAECRASEIRTLGRSERAAAVPRVAPFLKDPNSAVRTEAIWALAQIAKDSTAADTVAGLLSALGPRPLELGATARALGRVRLTNRGRAARTAALFDGWLAEAASPATMVEIVRGAESFVRVNGRVAPLGAGALGRLEQLVTYTNAGDPAAAARVRRAAVAALARAGRRPQAVLATALTDADPEVRRLAIGWASAPPDLAERRDAVMRGMTDPEPMVRLEALRAFGRHFQSADCGPVLRASRDRSGAVALQALDLLGNPCPDSLAAADALGRIVDSLAASPRGRIESLASWHRGVHALLALAKTAPARAATLLGRLAADPTWQVRAYAARAAGLVGDGDRLLALAADREDNVRQVAIGGLLKVRGHATDSVLRAQLARTDYQLVMTAAQLLEGAPDRPRAAGSLLAALRRLTAERRENSRDPRVAILDRLGELGDPALAPNLEPYLRDFDAEVANRAAGLIAKWTGVTKTANPVPLPGPVPDSVPANGTKLVVVMSPGSGGGSFEILLRPDLAPVTTARVVALARQGYYDLLTWHRVEPNFVIQGGSPNANEYYGVARFLADEVGPVSHERGTLGISTRGRNTGDAQLFVNLVDNHRLDFDYTVWGQIIRGMDVVDEILEGDVIERIETVDVKTDRRVR
jgi:cyclophilin family peptidyl-prolyl cis-trans isomerase